MKTTNPIQINQNQEEHYPRLLKRYQSIIIDYVFLITCMLVISQILDATYKENGTILRILLVLIFICYEPVCIALGCSLGNYIVGIRVRKFGEESKRISIFQSYIRFIIKLLLGIISFITISTNKYKRAIHDLASGSIMVYKKKDL